MLRSLISLLFAVALLLAGNADAQLAVPAACAWPNCPVPRDNTTVLSPAIYGGDYDPFGIIFIDIFKAFLGTINNGRDDDQDAVCGAGPDATDRACDQSVQDTTYISTTYTLNGNTAAYGTTLHIPNAARGYFCRDSSGLQQCQDGGNCVSTVSATHPATIIMRDAASGYYYPLSVTGISTCQGGGATTATIAVGQEVAFDSGVDTFQGFYYDKVHTNEYVHNFIGQYIATIPWDFIYRPKTGGMTNGNADTDCTGDANWVVSGGGSKAAGTFSYTDATASRALYGNSCRMTGRTANSYIETPFWNPSSPALDANSAYVPILCTGIAYSAASNATTTIRASYAGGNGYIQTQTLYIYDGGAVYSSSLAGNTLFAYDGTGAVTGNANQLAQPRQFAIRARAIAGVPFFGVRMVGSGTGDMWLDDVACSRVPENKSQPPDVLDTTVQSLLFPAGATIRPAAIGDSLFSWYTIPNGHSTYASGLDLAFRLQRPDVYLGTSVSGNNINQRGATSGHFMAQGDPVSGFEADGLFRWSRLLANRPSVVFDDTGAADFIYYYGPNEYVANAKAMAKALGARGINYVKIGPHPWHIDSTGGTMCHGSAAKTCGAFALDFSKAMAAFGVAN